MTTTTEKIVLQIPLADWAKALGFTCPDDIDSDVYLSGWSDADSIPVILEQYDLQIEDDDEEDLMALFEATIEAMRQDYEEDCQEACWKAFKRSLESATEYLLTFTDIKDNPPVNWTGYLGCPPPMKAPGNFPELKWELTDEFLNFYGSKAPVAVLVMIAQDGDMGCRYSGIREFTDNNRDLDAESVTHWVPKLQKVYGFSVDTECDGDRYLNWCPYDFFRQRDKEEDAVVRAAYSISLGQPVPEEVTSYLAAQGVPYQGEADNDRIDRWYNEIFDRILKEEFPGTSEVDRPRFESLKSLRAYLENL